MMSRDFWNVLFYIFALLVVFSSSLDAKAQATFDATEDTRVYGAVVDVRTGKPAANAIIRYLAPPETKIYTQEDVDLLSDALNVFDVEQKAKGLDSVGSKPLFDSIPIGVHEGEISKPVRTDSNGIVEFDVDFLDKYISIAGGDFDSMLNHDTSWMLATAPSMLPLSSKVSPIYRKLKITNRTFFVSGNILATYLPPVVTGLIKHEDSQINDQVKLDLFRLNAVAEPEVVLSGGKLKITSYWQYILMPQFSSRVAVENIKNASKLMTTEGEKGIIVETWETNDVDAGNSTGERAFDVVAYLDDPEKVLGAKRTKAAFYVAVSEEEAEVYRKLVKVEDWSAEKNREAIKFCQETVDNFPRMQRAWVEYAKRLIADNQKDKTLALWEKAPEDVRENINFINAVIQAQDFLSPDQDNIREEFARVLGKNKEVTIDAVVLLVAAAVEEKKYDLALAMLRSAKDKFLPVTYLSGEQWLSWMNGDRSSSQGARVSVANALLANENPEECLKALEDVNYSKLEKDDKKNYLEAKIQACLDLEQIDAIEEMVAKIEKLGEEPSSTILGKIAENDGDFQNAQEHYSKVPPMLDGTDDFVRATQKLLEEDVKASSWTTSAFSMLTLHRFAEALTMAKGAVERETESAAAHFALGLAQEFNGQMSAARSSLAKACELAPDCGFIQTEYEYALALDYISPKPPNLEKGPQSQNALLGNSITFEVTVGSDTLAATYQWRKDSEPLEGENAHKYTINSVTYDDEGIYNCVVTNPMGQVISADATLVVQQMPEITLQPVSQTVFCDESKSFTVEADGIPSVSYQWKKDGELIPNATTPTYRIDVCRLSDTGQYTCVVSNEVGETESDIATLEVQQVPLMDQVKQSPQVFGAITAVVGGVFFLLVILVIVVIRKLKPSGKK